MSKRKTIVYIDGYNLYYGIAKRLNCKWVDLHALFETTLTSCNLVGVKFFTAMSKESDSAIRQSIYLRALKTKPQVTVILGEHSQDDEECQVEGCLHEGNRWYSKWIEKQTDVNLAVEMVADAFEGKCEVQVLVSGDSDYIGAVKTIRSIEDGPKVYVLVPSLGAELEPNGSRASAPLRHAAHKSGDLTPEKLIPHQFPEILLDANGKQIKIPRTWRIATDSDWELLRNKILSEREV